MKRSSQRRRSGSGSGQHHDFVEWASLDEAKEEAMAVEPLEGGRALPVTAWVWPRWKVSWMPGKQRLHAERQEAVAIGDQDRCCPNDVLWDDWYDRPARK